MPLVGNDSEKKLQWISVLSTLPFESKLLQGNTLKQAIESRYMQDLQLLPNDTSDVPISRNNVELYADTPQLVAIAYATSKFDKIHFVIFENK